jgi:hypothetical protein
MPARYVPPSGFGYPLDGLLPSVPCRSSFIPAALLGFTLRRFPLQDGIRTFRFGSPHLPFEPSGVPAAEAPDRPDGSRFLGFSSLESLADERVFSPSPTGSSLGFSPSRVHPRRPGSGFRPTSSLTLRSTVFTALPAPQSFNRPSPGLSHLPCRNTTAEKGNPLRVSAPVHSRSFKQLADLAYGFASRRVMHYCRPSDDLELVQPLYRSCRDCPEVLSVGEA